MVALPDQVVEMTKLLQYMTLVKVNDAKSFVHVVQQVVELGCVGCGGPHNTDTCPQNTETVAYVKNDPYLNTYNAGWRNHLNFSWGVKSKTLKGDKMAKEIITAKHLAIAKDIIMIGHIIQPHTINKPKTLLHLLPNPWKPYSMNTCRGIISFYKAKPHQLRIWNCS